MMNTPQQFWLMKSEPSVFSIADLKREKVTGWEGVRNYQARNFMRDAMQPGDLVLFYHSNANPSGVAGVAKVVRTAEPDPTQFDKKSEYFDATSSKDNPRWVRVHVQFVEAFSELLTLEVLKTEPLLEGMLLLQKGQRLSVQPVNEKHFQRVLQLAQAKTKIR